MTACQDHMLEIIPKRSDTNSEASAHAAVNELANVVLVELILGIPWIADPIPEATPPSVLMAPVVIEDNTTSLVLSFLPSMAAVTL